MMLYVYPFIHSDQNVARVSISAEFKTMCQADDAGLVREVSRLSQAGNLRDVDQGCLLWGTILLEGLGKRKPPIPKLTIARCESICKSFSKDLEVRTLQVWWILGLGQNYLMPDFRHPDRIEYATITVNGKPTREPIYVQDGPSPIVKKAISMRSEIIKSDIRNPISYLYRLLNPKGDRQITNRELAQLAMQGSNPIRYYAEAELSKRHEMKGLPTKAQTEWKSLLSGNPYSEYLRMAIYYSNH